MYLETDIEVLRPEPGGECLFAFQTDVRRRLKVEADESQKREATLACELLNQMQALGRPQSYAIS